MNYYIERLNHELRNIMKFWHHYAFDKGVIACEVSNDGEVNNTALCGSVYMSRILYGASAASFHLNDDTFKSLADVAFFNLTSRMKNPLGGYYWALNKEGEIKHDENNIVLAQAFALFGLCQYYQLTRNNEVRRHLDIQVEFINNTIKLPGQTAYCDGYTVDWKSNDFGGFSLGSHIHLLEAFTHYYKLTREAALLTIIRDLVHTLMHYFIKCESSEIFHNLDKNWNPLPNENWIGHNLETCWIIYRATQLLDDQKLIQAANHQLLKFCDNAIEIAFDKNYGGMFNRFAAGKLVTSNKEWWPQAESVIAFFIAHENTHDKKYLSYAVRLLEYIDNTFSDSHYGEWFDSVTREGMPIYDIPKIHLWKSMYHNVRFCIESSEYLKNLYSSPIHN